MGPLLPAVPGQPTGPDTFLLRVNALLDQRRSLSSQPTPNNKKLGFFTTDKAVYVAPANQVVFIFLFLVLFLVKNSHKRFLPFATFCSSPLETAHFMKY